MKGTLTIFLTVSCLCGLALSTSYEGHKVYKVFPKTEVENTLVGTFKNKPNYDFWSPINKVGLPVSIMVSPDKQQDFMTFLAQHNIPHEVQLEDVQKNIDAERSALQNSKKHTKGARLDTSKYYDYDEINTYLQQLAEQYPDIVTFETIGQSYEGRDTNLVRITTNSSNGQPKPVIFVDGGIHAREWIAPAVALYLLNQLVEVPEHADLLTRADWVILPSVNPDGYVYTWTTDRLWRKTRSPGLLCDGVDSNRNFDYHWQNGGFRCTEDYGGPEPFSEVESRNLRDALLATDNLAAYVTFHSYGPYILYPYTYASGQFPENLEELADLGNRIAETVRRVGDTEYLVGSAPEILYDAPGTTEDWAMGVAGASISYTIELPGKNYGFVLPERFIAPVVVETFEGLKVLHDHVVSRK